MTDPAITTRPVGASRVNTYVMAIVILSVTAIFGVVAIAVMLRGDPERNAIMIMVLGIISPIVASLLAAALREVHTDVNSRLTEFLELTARASKAEGVVDGERTQRSIQEVARVALAAKNTATLHEEAIEAKATLNKIESNTAETATNTKQTEQSTKRSEAKLNKL